MQNHILYFTHGQKEFLNEAVFALLSYYAHHTEDENKVVVYTDNVDYFKQKLPLSITYIPLSQETIQKWKGDINFVHRVKIELLKDFATKFLGSVLYLDSDTYFKTNISPLFGQIQQGIPVMSLSEGTIGKSRIKHLKQFDSYFKKKNYQITIHNTTLDFQKDIRMYNAGIIGIQVPENAPLFDTALQITDYIYPENPSHVVEQFAFSYLLQTQDSAIIEAEPLIHHYWYFKEFRSIINLFFEKYKHKNFPELVALSQHINPEYIGSEKLTYKNATFLEKLRIKLTTFRKWKIKAYEL